MRPTSRHSRQRHRRVDETEELELLALAQCFTVTTTESMKFVLARPPSGEGPARPRSTAYPPFFFLPLGTSGLRWETEEMKRGSLSICRYRWPHDYRPVFSIQGEAYSDGHRASKAVASLATLQRRQQP